MATKHGSHVSDQSSMQSVDGAQLNMLKRISAEHTKQLKAAESRWLDIICSIGTTEQKIQTLVENVTKLEKAFFKFSKTGTKGEIGEYSGGVEDGQRHPEYAEGFLISIVMPKYKSLIMKNKDWRSQTFYTHNRGYNICLGVRIHNIGTSGQPVLLLSLYAVPGKYDDEIQWPVVCTFEVEIVNKQGGENLSFLTGDNKWKRPRGIGASVPLKFHDYESDIRCDYVTIHCHELADFVDSDAIEFWVRKWFSDGWKPKPKAKTVSRGGSSTVHKHHEKHHHTKRPHHNAAIVDTSVEGSHVSPAVVNQLSSAEKRRHSQHMTKKSEVATKKYDPEIDHPDPTEKYSKHRSKKPEETSQKYPNPPEKHHSKHISNKTEEISKEYDPVVGHPISTEKHHHSKHAHHVPNTSNTTEEDTHIYDAVADDPKIISPKHTHTHNANNLNSSEEDFHLYDAMAENHIPAKNNYPKQTHHHDANTSSTSVEDSELCGPMVTLLMPYDKKIFDEHLNWKSRPFYTHHHGPRIRLGVRSLRSTTNKRVVMLDLYAVPGEYDKDLQWPARYSFQVEVVNRDPDENGLVFSCDDNVWKCPKEETPLIFSEIDHDRLYVKHSVIKHFVRNNKLEFKVANRPDLV